MLRCARLCWRPMRRARRPPPARARRDAVMQREPQRVRSLLLLTLYKSSCSCPYMLGQACDTLPSQRTYMLGQAGDTLPIQRTSAMGALLDPAQAHARTASPSASLIRLAASVS